MKGTATALLLALVGIASPGSELRTMSIPSPLVSAMICSPKANVRES